jgi:2-amino-4-hydroxy-6-hydroxymethyldihydropteridine diphosphokinase
MLPEPSWPDASVRRTNVKPFWISLGSNLGDRAENLRKAREKLAEAGFREEASSSIFETAPVGPVEQGPFLNQVIRGRWEGTAEELLPILKGIEHRMGRREGPRWGPRVIDLDILLSGHRGEDVVREGNLKVPHPDLSGRAFALVPLAEIDPNLILPDSGTSVRESLPPPQSWKELVWPYDEGGEGRAHRVAGRISRGSQRRATFER